MGTEELCIGRRKLARDRQQMDGRTLQDSVVVREAPESP